ncbi:hypothetical protein ASG93_14280 [Paenibacillus sp. Soil787]|nr:hypothetical protein ASG93_14280 [Paenibacillus sp. Soil787]
MRQLLLHLLTDSPLSIVLSNSFYTGNRTWSNDQAFDYNSQGFIESAYRCAYLTGVPFLFGYVNLYVPFNYRFR